MRSKLVLHHPWEQPPQTWWYFSGEDDRVLRGYLDQLTDFAAPDADDRRAAAMVVRDDEQNNPSRNGSVIGAWTREGALRLVELLPDEFSDLQASILDRFANPS